jgi:hypothetical protein
MLGMRRPSATESADPGQLGALSPHEPTSGRRSWAMHRWHKENVQLFPKPLSLYDDVPRLFRDHILPGHCPQRPLLTEHDTVVTLGSCFALELRQVLELARFASGSFWIPSGLNNSFAILDFVSWCITGEGTSRAYRYERSSDGEIKEWLPEEERQRYLAHIAEAGAFVFTLGLAEVWSDRETGGVFWRGVPEDVFEEGRHVFRLSSVEENERNIVETIRLIRSVNPDAPIVLTLSPVPLEATFRDISCMTADCVSKSVLRVALDRVMSGEPENTYYWPSFELVKWAGSAFDWRAWEGDARHARRYLVYCIVDAFVEAFYGPALAANVRERLRDSGWATSEPHRLRRGLTESRRQSRALAARAGRAPARLRRLASRA